MRKSVMVALAVALCVVVPVLANSKLVQVQVLHRHGDRAPIGQGPPKYPIDWVTAIGVQPSQLTGTGTTQATQLGQWLRSRYIDETPLVSPNFVPTEVLVRSTQFDRTIATANAVLRSMFSGATRFDDVSNITTFASVPVNNQPRTNDIWLQGYDMCGSPKIAIINNLTESQMWKDKVASSQEFLTWFSNATGYAKVNFTTFYDYYDPVFVMYNHGLLHGNPIAERIEEIKDLAGWTEMTKIGASGKLSGGALLGAVMQYLNSALNTTLQTPRYIQWSAHDSTIMSLIVTMRLNNNPLFAGIPPYASAVVMELWADTDSRNPAQSSDTRLKIYFRNGVTSQVDLIMNSTFSELTALAAERALPTTQAWCDACGPYDSVTAPEVCLRLPTPTPSPSSSSSSSSSPYIPVAIAFIIYSVFVTGIALILFTNSRGSRRSSRLSNSHTESLLAERV